MGFKTLGLEFKVYGPRRVWTIKRLAKSFGVHTINEYSYLPRPVKLKTKNLHNKTLTPAAPDLRSEFGIQSATT